MAWSSRFSWCVKSFLKIQIIKKLSLYFNDFIDNLLHDVSHFYTGRNICWTAAVTDGIVNDRLKNVLKELGDQLLENVNLIRSGGLTKSLRSTLESLIIADSHAKTGEHNPFSFRTILIIKIIMYKLL